MAQIVESTVPGGNRDAGAAICHRRLENVSLIERRNT
jgi:hypothetical protein